MATRTIRALSRDDGTLELLEPVALPKHTVIMVTLEALDDAETPATAPVLPVRKLGPMKCIPSRDEIYAERTR